MTSKGYMQACAHDKIKTLWVHETGLGAEEGVSAHESGADIALQPNMLPWASTL